MKAADHSANTFQHEYLGAEHLLLGILNTRKGIAVTAMENVGIATNHVRHALEAKMISGPSSPPKRKPTTPSAKKIIEHAMTEAQHCGHRCVGTGHLLLGLLASGQTLPNEVLRSVGVVEDKIRPEIIRLHEHASAALHDDLVPSESEPSVFYRIGRWLRRKTKRNSANEE
ncbi:MAG: hypothetical protein IIA67_04415 [Planctomycetes bacterium]|nr:hypothetical protein [Planctomycetota bacterium]